MEGRGLKSSMNLRAGRTPDPEKNLPATITGAQTLVLKTEYADRIHALTALPNADRIHALTALRHQGLGTHSSV